MAEELEVSGPEPSIGIMPDHPRFLRHRLLLFIFLLLGAWIAYKCYYRPLTVNVAPIVTVMEDPVRIYATHLRPKFTDMVLVKTLDQSLVPAPGNHKHMRGRLVIVGDVHGMKNELMKLLDKVKFDSKIDHLILTGDMISKGPDSPGVLELVMKLGATSVRGNHEDRVLLAHSRLQSKDLQQDLDPLMRNPTVGEKLSENEIFSYEGEIKDRLLAEQLSRKHIEWLKKCPVILRVGEIDGMGEVLVVHAGLVPGISLNAQDPYFVMNMRTIDLKTHIPSDSRGGTRWTKPWNYYQARLELRQRSTVIYGHDSRQGLSLNKYSKGLDTGCQKGGNLTALVIAGGFSRAKQTIVQVNCVDGRT